MTLRQHSTAELHEELERRALEPLVDFAVKMAKATGANYSLYRKTQQDKTWVDAFGTERRLEDLGSSHCENLIKWFNRRAASIKAAEIWVAPLLEYNLWTDDDDWIWEDKRQAISDEEDPVAWLQEQPLLRRLREINRMHVQQEASRYESRLWHRHIDTCGCY